MASDKVPTNAGQVIELANNMSVGLGKTGPSVPVTMVTKAQMDTERQEFSDAESVFSAARSEAQTESNVYQATLVAVYIFLQAARNALVPKLGRRWTTAWAQAGFVNGSTAVPSRIAARLSLAQSLATFFGNNPSYEAPSLGVTAIIANARRDAALTAQGVWTDAEMLKKDAETARTSAYNTLIATMRTLISNLARKLGPNDPRWLAFGLKQPGTSQTPGKPVNLTAHTDGSGLIIVTCDAVPLAMRYRWRMLLVGVQSEYLLAARSVDPIGTISGVLPGQRVRLLVQAVNGNLQGKASDSIEFTLPLTSEAKAPEPAAPAATAERAIETEHRNGGANGHTNGRRQPVRLS